MTDTRLKAEDVYITYSGQQEGGIRVLRYSGDTATWIYFGKMGVCLTPVALDMLFAKIEEAISNTGSFESG